MADFTVPLATNLFRSIDTRHERLGVMLEEHTHG
jgi:hypothetical protein